MATRKRIIKASVLLLVFALAAGCRSDILFTDQTTFKPAEWNRADIIDYEADIADTTSVSTVKITMRTGSAYPYRNIFLFISTYGPDGLNVRDTLEYLLGDERGNRIGKGTGDIREVSLIYRDNIYFPTPGKYRFVIEHAMRKPTLEGVYDVGIHISRKSNKKR